MARTWNDLLYGPPPRRNRSTDTTPNATPPPKSGSDSETDSDIDSDIDSEYERELREQEIRAKHRCFNKHCRCFEKDKENWFASAEPPTNVNVTPTKKNNARPTRGSAAQQKKQRNK